MKFERCWGLFIFRSTSGSPTKTFNINIHLLKIVFFWNKKSFQININISSAGIQLFIYWLVNSDFLPKKAFPSKAFHHFGFAWLHWLVSKYDATTICNTSVDEPPQKHNFTSEKTCLMPKRDTTAWYFCTSNSAFEQI